MITTPEQARRTTTDLPKVRCKLVGQDGNAFVILGRFQIAARQAGWTGPQIAAVCKEAMRGDYGHLLCTIMEYCKNP